MEIICGLSYFIEKMRTWWSLDILFFCIFLIIKTFKLDLQSGHIKHSIKSNDVHYFRALFFGMQSALLVQEKNKRLVLPKCTHNLTDPLKFQGISCFQFRVFTSLMYTFLQLVLSLYLWKYIFPVSFMQTMDFVT